MRSTTLSIVSSCSLLCMFALSTLCSPEGLVTVHASVPPSKLYTIAERKVNHIARRVNTDTLTFSGDVDKIIEMANNKGRDRAEAAAANGGADMVMLEGNDSQMGDATSTLDASTTTPTPTNGQQSSNGMEHHAGSECPNTPNTPTSHIPTTSTAPVTTTLSAPTLLAATTAPNTTYKPTSTPSPGQSIQPITAPATFGTSVPTKISSSTSTSPAKPTTGTAPTPSPPYIVDNSEEIGVLPTSSPTDEKIVWFPLPIPSESSEEMSAPTSSPTSKKLPTEDSGWLTLPIPTTVPSLAETLNAVTASPVRESTEPTSKPQEGDDPDQNFPTVSPSRSSEDMVVESPTVPTTGSTELSPSFSPTNSPVESPPHSPPIAVSPTFPTAASSPTPTSTIAATPTSPTAANASGTTSTAPKPTSSEPTIVSPISQIAPVPTVVSPTPQTSPVISVTHSPTKSPSTSNPAGPVPVKSPTVLAEPSPVVSPTVLTDSIPTPTQSQTGEGAKSPSTSNPAGPVPVKSPTVLAEPSPVVSPTVLTDSIPTPTQSQTGEGAKSPSTSNPAGPVPVKSPTVIAEPSPIVSPTVLTDSIPTPTQSQTGEGEQNSGNPTHTPGSEPTAVGNNSDNKTPKPTSDIDGIIDTAPTSPGNSEELVPTVTNENGSSMNPPTSSPNQSSTTTNGHGNSPTLTSPTATPGGDFPGSPPSAFPSVNVEISSPSSPVAVSNATTGQSATATPSAEASPTGNSSASPANQPAALPSEAGKIPPSKVTDTTLIACDESSLDRFEFVEFTYSLETETNDFESVDKIRHSTERVLSKDIANLLLPCGVRRLESGNALGFQGVDYVPEDSFSSTADCDPNFDVKNDCSVFDGILTIYISQDADFELAKYYTLTAIREALALVDGQVSGLVKAAYLGPEILNPSAIGAAEIDTDGISPGPSDVNTSLVLFAVGGCAFAASVGLIYYLRRHGSASSGAATQAAGSDQQTGREDGDRPLSPFSEMLPSAYRFDQDGNMSAILELDDESATQRSAIVVSDSGFTTEEDCSIAQSIAISMDGTASLNRIDSPVLGARKRHNESMDSLLELL